MDISGMDHFDLRKRCEWIDSLENKEEIFDVAIIGGGITGAGIANIMASNGVKCILLEMKDFGSGTSSGSSKLIHGGIRYLANFEIREVRDLLHERNYLLKHSEIVKPMNFKILVDQYSWKKTTLRLGIFVYNILSGSLSIPMYVRNRGEMSDSIKGYFNYKDAWTDDTKMVIYNIVSAVRKGAICLNYSKVLKIEDEKDHVFVEFKDSIRQVERKVRARYVINAAGPWAGEVSRMEDSKFSGSLKLSRGIHVVVPSEKIGSSDSIVFRSHLDSRQMFIIPRGEVTIIGTTDRFVNSPDDFAVDNDDVEYIVESAKRLYPDLDKSDITYSYAGIRPLYGDSDDPGSISRGFVVKVKGRFINIYGGKLTNYRSVSRKVAKIYGKIVGKKLNVKGLPEINYNRPKLVGKDLYQYERDYECAIFPEDILIRREAYPFNLRDRGDSLLPEIEKVMKLDEKI
ncbi:glycerol-3-phosphate dehydrogenase/oxidase [Cuniculiplasma sp. SKW4]|uniref:glycerol-3-phosphate dehydrogenase/oxidase n=1 Tax=Cuniculiplasma sp. SKW4 TaxID=3400171 RepID=UPI003FD3BB8F